MRSGTDRQRVDVTTPSWPGVLGRLLSREELSVDEAAWAFDEIMAGEATDAQIAAFAVLLRAKGETPGELAGVVRTMLERSPRPAVSGRSVDVVGTGGDRAHTVNISTMAALVVAGSGRQVTKHGNRAASSRSGAADVLEELGVVIDLPAEGVSRTTAEAGIGFCFAPVFHAGMRHAGSARRELGVPTVFNLLGPLANPARPTAIAAGCADVRLAPVMAQVLAARGDTALVVHGDDGLDELTTTTTSHVWTASAGHVHEHVVDPSDLDIAPATAEDLRGGDATFNAQVVRDVLAGGGGAVRDAVLLNAAAGIAAFDDDVEDLDGGLARGVIEATRSVDSGSAAALLERWVTVSREVKAALGGE